MNIRKELFEEINNTAKENSERAQGMIDILNMMNPTNDIMKQTRFVLINKRVCYETIENGIKKFHDAYVYTK